MATKWVLCRTAIYKPFSNQLSDLANLQPSLWPPFYPLRNAVWGVLNRPANVVGDGIDSVQARIDADTIPTQGATLAKRQGLQPKIEAIHRARCVRFYKTEPLISARGGVDLVPLGVSHPKIQKRPSKLCETFGWPPRCKLVLGCGGGINRMATIEKAPRPMGAQPITDRKPLKIRNIEVLPGACDPLVESRQS